MLHERSGMRELWGGGGNGDSPSSFVRKCYRILADGYFGWSFGNQNGIYLLGTIRRWQLPWVHSGFSQRGRRPEEKCSYIVSLYHAAGVLGPPT